MAELKKVLGFWTILSLAIASIMGTGLFFGVSIAANLSGNASIMAWIILTVIGIYISTYFFTLEKKFQDDKKGKRKNFSNFVFFYRFFNLCFSYA